MRDFWYDFGLPLVALIGFLWALFAALIGSLSALEVYQCRKYEAVTGKPTRYEGLTCYVQDAGSWYSWTEYKHRLVAKGEFSK